MKLLYCKKCKDVFNLSLRKIKRCSCGASEGKYIDNKNAEYSGPAIPFAVDNYSFTARALKGRNTTVNKAYDTMHGEDKIQAWIMRPENPNYETIKKVRRQKPKTQTRRLGRC